MKTDVASLAPSCLGLAAPEGTTAAHREPHSYARQLARIEAALDRMETGRYGFCLACAGQIGLNRLEADPAEAVCETCDMGEDA
ncbi:MAG: hypothetical protein R3C08_10455 [Hyphomonas sp.]|nr:hypothetical protein [Hyphomonas sp.]HRX74267.1 hypothetical protein [Hyphomonas sp.]